MLGVSKPLFLISLSLTGLEASFLSEGHVTLHFLGKTHFHKNSCRERVKTEILPVTFGSSGFNIALQMDSYDTAKVSPQVL